MVEGVVDAAFESFPLVASVFPWSVSAVLVTTLVSVLDTALPIDGVVERSALLSTDIIILIGVEYELYPTFINTGFFLLLPLCCTEITNFECELFTLKSLPLKEPVSLCASQPCVSRT